MRPTSDGRKQADASRTDGAIRIDGRLDEEAWRHAEPIRDFVQKEPTEGAPREAVENHTEGRGAQPILRYSS